MTYAAFFVKFKIEECKKTLQRRNTYVPEGRQPVPEPTVGGYDDVIDLETQEPKPYVVDYKDYLFDRKLSSFFCQALQIDVLKALQNISKSDLEYITEEMGSTNYHRVNPLFLINAMIASNTDGLETFKRLLSVLQERNLSLACKILKAEIEREQLRMYQSCIVKQLRPGPVVRKMFSATLLQLEDKEAILKKRSSEEKSQFLLEEYILKFDRWRLAEFISVLQETDHCDIVNRIKIEENYV